jgi:hypothetical protein
MAGNSLLAHERRAAKLSRQCAPPYCKSETMSPAPPCDTVCPQMKRFPRSGRATRLLLSDLPEIPGLYPHLPETTSWLQQSKRFRRALYGNDRVNSNHSWAMATFLGHSAPGVSFASYCHTFDILLPEFLGNCHGWESIEARRERVRLSSSRGRSGGLPRTRSRPCHSPRFGLVASCTASSRSTPQTPAPELTPSNTCKVIRRHAQIGTRKFTCKVVCLTMPAQRRI